MNELQQKVELSYPNRYIVAHIDILGTKSFLNDNEYSYKFITDLNKLYNVALGNINSLSEDVREEFKLEKDGFEFSDFYVKTKIFSDNICIYLKLPEKEETRKERLRLTWFLQLLANFQFLAIIDYGFIVRGGVDIGVLYENDIFINGNALSSAYTLESKKAKSPRIILGDELKKYFSLINNSGAIPFSRKDSDGELFIDYLLYSYRKDDAQLSILKKHKDILIDKFEGTNDIYVQMKIIQSMIYHNRYCLNSNEWDTKYRTGECTAKFRKTTPLVIDITNIVMTKSNKLLVRTDLS